MCDRNSAVLEQNSSTASGYAVSVSSVPCGLTPSLNFFHICFAPQFPYSGAEIVLVSGVSFSFEYTAILPLRKSVPFGTVTSSPQRQLMGSGGMVSPPRYLPDECGTCTLTKPVQ